MTNFCATLAFFLAHGAAIPHDSVDARTAQPERPTVATHAHTVAPRYLELETGIQGFDVRAGRELDTPTLLKIGIASHLQADVITSYTHVTTPATRYGGVTDITAALKWQLLEKAPILGDFAIQPGVKFPTAPARTTGTGTTDVSLLLISSHTVGPVAVDLNAGVTRRSGDGSTIPTTATLWTASAGMPVTMRLGWVAEIFGYPGTAGVAGTQPSVGVLTGPTYTLRPWLVLDAGTVFNASGLGSNSVYAGLTWNVGHW